MVLALFGMGSVPVLEAAKTSIADPAPMVEFVIGVAVWAVPIGLITAAIFNVFRDNGN